MKLALALFALTISARAQSAPPKMAIVGLLHSHVWSQLSQIAKRPIQLVGVAEPNKDLVAEAQKAGIADSLIFDDYVAMLDKTKPDFIWAFVENDRHLEIVKACASRHIHVIFEKPLAATYKDAVAIRDISKKSNIFVMTNYQMAWWPAQYAAREAVDRGDVGKVYRIRGVVGHGGPGSDGVRNKIFFDWLTDPVKNGGGALMDFGCYNALWSLWYLGKPETVYAVTQHLQPERFPKVEDNATLILHYKDAEAILEGSWDLPRSFQDLEVFGRKGVVTMVNGKAELRKGRDTTALTLPTLAPENGDPVSYMANVVLTKKAPAGLVAVDINVGVVEIIEAAKESIKTGKPVHLK